MIERFEVEIVPLKWLKSHEDIKPKKYEKLLEISKKWGAQRKPILVDRKTGVILDGHHRHAVAKELGLQAVAVVAINYLSSSLVSLELRGNNNVASVTKDQVISMGLSGSNFPAKTTKHVLALDLPDIWVDFSELN